MERRRIASEIIVALAVGACGLSRQTMAADPKIDTPRRPPGAAFILGADISWVQQQEDEGTRFLRRGRAEDMFAILKGAEFNWIRLRIFYNPHAPPPYSPGYWTSVCATLSVASRIAYGLRIVEDAEPNPVELGSLKDREHIFRHAPDGEPRAFVFLLLDPGDCRRPG